MTRTELAEEIRTVLATRYRRSVPSTEVVRQIVDLTISIGSREDMIAIVHTDPHRLRADATPWGEPT